jgi:hypothetical protein
VVAGGVDAAGMDAAISSCALCGTGLSVVALVAGGSLSTGALRWVQTPDVALCGAGGAPEIEDGAVSCVVALLTGATFGIGSLGPALAGVAGAAGIDGAVSFGAALVTGAGDFTAAPPGLTGAGVASTAGGGPDGTCVESCGRALFSRRSRLLGGLTGRTHVPTLALSCPIQPIMPVTS